MKKYITLLLLLLPFALFCETEDSTTARKFEIGFTFSPDYCYRTLKPDASASSNMIADIRDTLEIPKLGYSVGLNFVVNINKKISLETGLLFSDKGEKTKKYSLGNSPTGSLPITNTYIYHYHYLDIPIKANYYILTGKLKLFVTAGISTNIFLGQKTVSILEYSNKGESPKNKSKINSGFSTINFAAIAGLGIDYPITDKFNFKLEPIYRRSITSIINAPVKSYLYSAGLTIGIYYKL